MEAQAELPMTRAMAAIRLIMEGRRIFRVGIFVMWLEMKSLGGALGRAKVAGRTGLRQRRTLQGERDCWWDGWMIHPEVGGVTAWVREFLVHFRIILGYDKLSYYVKS